MKQRVKQKVGKEASRVDRLSDAEPICVLHIASPAAVGGLERVLHALAIGHHQRGHRVHVAATLDSEAGNPGFVDPLRDAGVPVHLEAVSLRSVLSERRFVHDLCQEISPDVVHTHGYRPDIVDSGVARKLGIASVSTEHGFSKMGGRTAVYEWLQMRLFPRFDGVIAVSKRINDALLAAGVDPDRLDTIPNAWADNVRFLDRTAARRELGIPDDLFAVGFVGRMIDVKGGDVLVRALAQVADPGVIGVFVGDGIERETWSALAAELAVTPRPLFGGEILEAAPYMSAFDLFAMPSRSEGTPITLFEAMASGVPIAVSAVGGVPDVVTPAEAALVPADDPHALAEAIRSARANPAAANTRAERARQRLAERYALEPWLDRYERFYRDVLARR